MTTQLRKNRSDSAMVRTDTYTTHVVDVDLEALLGSLDIGFADTVVLHVRTPSGRAKRVTLAPSFLIKPHHVVEADLYN